MGLKTREVSSCLHCRNWSTDYEACEYYMTKNPHVDRKQGVHKCPNFKRRDDGN